MWVVEGSMGVAFASGRGPDPAGKHFLFRSSGPSELSSYQRAFLGCGGVVLETRIL